VGDLGIHPVKITRLQFVAEGFTIGPGHFELQGGDGNDQVRPLVCVHRRSGAGSEDPFVNARAGIFRGHSRGHGRRGVLRTLEELDIEHLKRCGAGVVDTVDQRCDGLRANGQFAGLGWSDRAFRFVEVLLCDGAGGELNGHAIVRVDVKERAVAGRNDNVHNDNRIVSEDHMMEGLLLHRDGDGRRRGSILCGEDAGKSEQQRGRKIGSHGKSPLSFENEANRTPVRSVRVNQRTWVWTQAAKACTATVMWFGVKVRLTGQHALSTPALE